MFLSLYFTIVMALLPFQLAEWLVAGSAVVPSAASMMDHATSSSAVSSTNSFSSCMWLRTVWMLVVMAL